MHFCHSRSPLQRAQIRYAQRLSRRRCVVFCPGRPSIPRGGYLSCWDACRNRVYVCGCCPSMRMWGWFLGVGGGGSNPCSHCTGAWGLLRSSHAYSSFQCVSWAWRNTAMGAGRATSTKLVRSLERARHLGVSGLLVLCGL